MRRVGGARSFEERKMGLELGQDGVEVGKIGQS